MQHQLFDGIRPIDANPIDISPACRNWHTNGTQNAAPIWACAFESRRGHHISHSVSMELSITRCGVSCNASSYLNMRSNRKLINCQRLE